MDADRYMRAVNLKKSAGELYKASSPRLKRFFEVMPRGANAYLSCCISISCLPTCRHLLYKPEY